MRVLKPFQERLIGQLIGLLASTRRGLIVAPTGSGKTLMMTRVIEQVHARKPNARTLVLQHLLTLMDQNAQAMQFASGLTVATAGRSKTTDVMTADVVVGSRDTIINMLPFIGGFDLVFIDEAHRAPGESYREILETLQTRNPLMLVAGVTATPERHDRVGLADVFGPRAAIVTHSEVIASGLIVPPRVLSNDLRSVRHLLGDGDDASDINMQVANEEVARLHQLFAEGRRSVYFCRNVAHAESLAVEFEANGIRSAVISHLTKKRAHDTILRELREDAGPEVVMCATLLLEGFDAPPVSCVGLLRGFVSKTALIQACGRAGRAHPGKSDYLVLDYLGRAEAHGSLSAGLDLEGRERAAGAARAQRDRDGYGPIDIGLGSVSLRAVDLIADDYIGALGARPDDASFPGLELNHENSFSYVDFKCISVGEKLAMEEYIAKQTYCRVAPECKCCGSKDMNLTMGSDGRPKHKSYCGECNQKIEKHKKIKPRCVVCGAGLSGRKNTYCSAVCRSLAGRLDKSRKSIKEDFKSEVSGVAKVGRYWRIVMERGQQ